MTAYYLGYMALVTGAVAFASGIAVMAWRNRRIAGSVPLIALMLAVSVWGIAKLLELWSTGIEGTLFWANLQYAAIVFVPVAWLVFTLSYTGRDGWLSGPVLALLAVEPVAVQVAVWTNERHGLFRTSADLVSYGPVSALEGTLGPAFWIHAAYSSLLLAVGTGALITFVLLSDDLYRGQSLGLLTAALVPWAGNAVNLSGASPPGLDPTVVAFAATGGILLTVITRHRLLGVAPVAREVARSELIDRMADAVIVVDQRNRVIDWNPAAESIVGEELADEVGNPLSSVYPPLDDAIGSEPSDENEEFRTELEVRADTTFKHYDVRVTRLERGFGAVAGRLINLRDVTDRRQREQQLDVLNRLLRHNVRNELNVVQGNVTLLGDLSTTDRASEHIDIIESTVETMIERSEKATRLANQAGLETYGSTDLTAELAALVEETRQEHPRVTIRFDAPVEAPVAAGTAVVTAIDELVTNSIVHNDSEAPTVSISVTTDAGIDGRYVEVEVSDDGPGIPRGEMDPIRRGRETPLDHGSGVGLWLVTWIVREVDGDIEFIDTADGTTVSVFIPSNETGSTVGGTVSPSDSTPGTHTPTDDDRRANGPAGSPDD